MASMEFRTETRQHQTLSPRLQHAVRLLQLSSLDFAHEVQAALGKNPFLESDDLDPDAEEIDAGEAMSNDDRDDADVDGADGNEVDGEAIAAAAAADDDSERDTWQADDVFGSRNGGDGDVTAMDLMATESSLATHLHGQLNLLTLSDRDLVLAKTIVESLDDDGYLRMDLAEVIGIAELSPAADAEEVHIALRRVQSLEPMGVGARDVAECLTLQLSKLDTEAERDMAHRIINEHLERLAAKDVTVLA